MALKADLAALNCDASSWHDCESCLSFNFGDNTYLARQTKFYWHVMDKGICHAYIEPSSPQLNGKVERSHRSDGQEFYQLLSYKVDVDLEAKLTEWERFYNFARPHGAVNGKTPYEALRETL